MAGQVLLLHGWGANATTMRPIFDALRPTTRSTPSTSPASARVRSRARRGESASTPSSSSPSSTRLASEKTDVVGHSFGGRVGIKLAAKWPERVERLVLVDSAGVPPRAAVGRAAIRAGLRVGRPILERARAWGACVGRLESLARDRLGSEDYRSAGRSARRFVKVVAEDLRPLLPEIKAPTLLIWGENDQDTPLADARVMEASIPDAGLVVLTGAGHFSYLDRPADFARIVRHFLA